MPFLIHFISGRGLITNVGQTDLFLVCDQGSLVDLKFLCAAVTIHATIVNIQTHTKSQTQTDSILITYINSINVLSFTPAAFLLHFQCIWNSRFKDVLNFERFSLLQSVLEKVVFDVCKNLFHKLIYAFY